MLALTSEDGTLTASGKLPAIGIPLPVAVHCAAEVADAIVVQWRAVLLVTPAQDLRQRAVGRGQVTAAFCLARPLLDRTRRNKRSASTRSRHGGRGAACNLGLLFQLEGELAERWGRMWRDQYAHQHVLRDLAGAPPGPAADGVAGIGARRFGRLLKVEVILNVDGLIVQSGASQEIRRGYLHLAEGVAQHNYARLARLGVVILRVDSVVVQ
mmetsp:Transcript_144109/g.401513  ORF Transcript_144109/g.401513 Transcript_144109/m.401513 type:complete len:212 (+) Transcript_144109:35-670(+)